MSTKEKEEKLSFYVKELEEGHDNPNKIEGRKYKSA
jgi:hypothetical protein